MGFFLDGDDAQLPVILGIFANTGYIMVVINHMNLHSNLLQDIQVKLNQIQISFKRMKEEILIHQVKNHLDFY